MKPYNLASMVAVSFLSFSSFAFSADMMPEGPTELTAMQMDNVTAGGDKQKKQQNEMRKMMKKLTKITNTSTADVTQINVSPVTIIQISVLNGPNSGNVAYVTSGNFSTIRQ